MDFHHEVGENRRQKPNKIFLNYSSHCKTVKVNTPLDNQDKHTNT